MSDSTNSRDEESFYPKAEDVRWDIRREGRAWKGDEAWDRWQLTPEKLEMWDGKALFDDNERVHFFLPHGNQS